MVLSFPFQKIVWRYDNYVDDIPTGDKTEEGREEQICQEVAALNKVKFSLKHITWSGEKPGDKASTDAELD